MIPKEKMHIAEELSERALNIPMTKRGQRRGMTAIINAFVEQIPEATNKEIADFLIADQSYVGVVCRRHRKAAPWVPPALGRFTNLKIPPKVKVQLYHYCYTNGISTHKFITDAVVERLKDAGAFEGVH